MQHSQQCQSVLVCAHGSCELRDNAHLLMCPEVIQFSCTSARTTYPEMGRRVNEGDKDGQLIVTDIHG